MLESRSARALDEDSDGRVLVASDLTGTFQLFELDGELRQLTDFAEPAFGRYVTGTRTAVVEMDAGGDERHQLYLLDLDAPPLGDAGRLVPLTADPEHVHELAGVRPDGREIAYVSNRRNGVDFDVYVLDLATRESTAVYTGGGWAAAATGYSPSGRHLSFLLPGPRPLDLDLCLADLRSGELRRPLAHPDEAALVGGPAWLSEDTFVVSSNVGRDLAALVWHDLTTADSLTVLERDHDLECFGSSDGSALLVVANAGGASEAELFRPRERDGAPSLESLGAVALPGRGVIAGSMAAPPPLVAPGGAHVTYTFSSPLVPGDVWRAQPGAAAATRLTRSPGPDPAALVEPSVESVASFDGEPLPAFVYRPAGAGAAAPVVLVIHGGPESQAMLVFNPVVQALVDRGFGVVVPNVRGSTGYGKRYAGLDDTVRRLDSVRDLAAIHDWLPSAGFDAGRAALFGGSYGGYMVLAGVAFQPERWAAGVDIVGISDLVTFLEHTADYRRSHREREYGSLAHDRTFLEQASPLRRADAIRAPLFVIHGENDPRVPVSEAHQLVESLARRGIDHELLIFADEGHGLAKLRNRLDAYPRAVAFLERQLGC
jgi:dipeptidyl aminopeptidase/acylaminoacyl peptidase